MRLYIFGLLSYLLFVGFSYGECFYGLQGFVECSQTKKIILDQKLNMDISMENKNINISDMDFPDPSECENSFCYKEIQISVTVKKIWKPMAAIINSDSLTSRTFAEDFQNISEKKLLNNNSSIYDRFVLQKILYERGLLQTKPTGKIGYLTEQAIMKLQCIKGFEEYDKKSGMFIIGPKTISEINKLKERMKDPNYLKKTRFPAVDFAKCGYNFKERNDDLNNLLGNPPTWANNVYLNAIIPNYFLKPEGEVKIKKTE